ncbi:FecR domain-containing protein [Dyadobacter sp. 676]|uniref:FecR domain-containing protein n=1 Tax=Dyadobacter sp. 676 TaxID=3088362 RepID=A0AAU8FG37_9BACT
MDKANFRNLVKRYLDGTATEAERRWLEAYDESVGQDSWYRLDATEADRIGNEIAAGIDNNIAARPARHSAWRAYSVAAMLVLAIGAGLFLVLKKDLPDTARPTYTEIKVPFGKIKKIKLEDGTQVTLNAGSSLTYPATFEKDSRKVSLTGEAFFDVAHQNGKPFIVNTQKLQIRVLGTRFNVGSYPGEETARVAVVSGKVSVQNRAKSADHVILTAGEFALGTVAGLQKSNIDSAAVLAWQNGQLNFKDETFKTVAAALERRYNVRIRVAKAIEQCRVYANIGNEPVQEALGALALMMQAQLSGSGKNFQFSGTECH